MAYKYIDPLTQGHKKFKLSKRHHNILFKNRKIRWTDKYEYYYNEISCHPTQVCELAHKDIGDNRVSNYANCSWGWKF